MVDAAGARRPGSAETYAVPSPAGEDEFRLIADSAPVPVWVTRLDRRRSFVNRAYSEFLGTDHEEALAFDWRKILHPEDAPRIVAESLAGEASLQTFALEARYRRADGAWRWMHSVSRPRWDGAGRHIGFIGVAYDITDAKEAELALREREAQFAAFVNQGTAGFAQVDISGRFTLVNDRFCEITGYNRYELLLRTMQSITHPDDLPRNIPLFEQAVRDGTPYAHEKRYVRPDGSIVWVNNSVAVIRRPDGEPYGVLSITLDVTQRREAEAALRKSEQSLRLAVESAGMATWELDPETLDGEWSPNRFDLLGLPRAPDLRGSFEDWLARMHPEDRDVVRSMALRCLRHGVPYTIEYRILRADTGEVRWLQSHGSRIDGGEDGPSRFVGISFDVTERKRGEQDLRASEGRFRTIFEQANDFIFTSGIDQRVTSCNPAVANALGYTPEEMIGRSFSEFLDPAEFRRTRDMLVQKLATGGTTRYSVRVRSRTGEELVWEVNSTLIYSSAGVPTSLFAIARDVTEASRYEAHQRLLIDELNHRVKNTLAIVQGIAQQTFRPDADPGTARAGFEARLTALAGAHDLLTRERWSPVPMTRIIADAMAPHLGCGTRITMAGPGINIGPKTAISLALAVHELATNAVKHGALSTPEGCIAIDWTVETSGDVQHLRFEWVESNGPPVSAPERRGFGTRMIERGLAAELNGVVRIEFAPEGLRCVVDAPLPPVTA